MINHEDICFKGISSQNLAGLLSLIGVKSKVLLNLPTVYVSKGKQVELDLVVLLEEGYCFKCRISKYKT